MALFEVPGWSLPNAPTRSTSNTRKRKRPSDAPGVAAAAAAALSSGSSSTKLRSAVQNMERLMASLGSEPDGESTKLQDKKQKKDQPGKSSRVNRQREPTDGPLKSRPESKQSESKAASKGKQRGSVDSKVKQKESAKETRASVEEATPVAKKQRRGRGDGKHSSQKNIQPTTKPQLSETKGKKKEEGLTALQANMKHSLDGARFRWINETLYKSDSGSAHNMMRENPDVFSEYHAGFRHQVHSWPDNPVSHYIFHLSSRPSGTVIVDLGCGDAALAKALTPKGLVVISYDLVSDGDFVVEADICARIPLPGSENEDGAQVADVVICALSLMSTNWVGCIREAWRILKPRGELQIAEVTSRFTDMEAFTSVVSSVGFKLKSKDERNTHFTLFEFVKIAREIKSEKEWQKLMARKSILKPCEYKRR
ncbi:methyltransferase-domain-containing protein [Cytidiella melzeri]|nr:methyltransferase-domain-containing protein [Cytidiella melzeri]